jgi:hypothetical protein
VRDVAVPQRSSSQVRTQKERPVDTSRFHRTTAVVGLTGSALLFAVSTVLQPDLSGSGQAVLARLHDAGWHAAVSAAAFAVAQLPYIAAVLGIGHLLSERTPRLGAWGAVLSVIGAFGHTVFGGISLVFVVMAGDTAHRNVYAGLFSDVQSSPVMALSLLGTLGFVVGLVLLSIGLFRGRVGPRWLGPALWLFLVVEFVGSSLSTYASYVSTTVLLVVFITLARESMVSWEKVPGEELEPVAT